MARGGRRVFSWERVRILGEVEVWGDQRGTGTGGEHAPRSELGERGRLEGWDLGWGLRSGAVVEAEEEEGEGEGSETGRRWNDIGVQDRTRGLYSVVTRRIDGGGFSFSMAGLSPDRCHEARH